MPRLMAMGMGNFFGLSTITSDSTVLNSFFSCPEYLEYCPLGIDKGSGVRYLCSYLGISLENAYAVGDERNDIPMLQAAGTGIAMENAHGDTKAAADYVTEHDNEHDAIAEIVKAQKPDRPVHETTFGQIEPAWLSEMESQPAASDTASEIHTKDITLQKLSLHVSQFSLKDLTSFLRMFAEETYRIKGFVTLPEGRFVVDCVGPLVDVRPFEGAVPEENVLVVLFGNGLPARKAIKEACSWFPNSSVEVV